MVLGVALRKIMIFSRLVAVFVEEVGWLPPTSAGNSQVGLKL